MLQPPTDAPAIEHVEWQLWQLMARHGAAVGEQRFRRVVRLVVRYFPEAELRAIVRSGHWHGAERKRLHRVLAARVRETLEAIDHETIDAWPLVLNGTVSLVWVALQEQWRCGHWFRDRLPEMRDWVARHGVEPCPPRR